MGEAGLCHKKQFQERFLEVVKILLSMNPSNWKPLPIMFVPFCDQFFTVTFIVHICTGNCVLLADTTILQCITHVQIST